MPPVTRTRLADVAAFACLSAGLVVLLTLWPVSCLRADGVAALSDAEPTMRWVLTPAAAAVFANRTPAERAQLAQAFGLLESNNGTGRSALLMPVPASHAFCRITLSQRNGQFLLSHVGPPSAWWDGDDVPPPVRFEHRPAGPEPIVYATDLAGHGWTFGGFDMADTTAGPAGRGVPHRAVAVPHWFVGLALLAWPAVRAARRRRLGAARGFDVTLDVTPA